jgi:hypothetical protein
MDAKPKKRELPPAAERALKEAEERRAARKRATQSREPEIGGPQGPDPVRYGDWEKDGIASDF